MTTKSLLLSGLLLAAPFAPQGHAAVYVHSTFEDSVAGAPGRTAVVASNDSNITPWYIVNSNTPANLAVVDDAGGLGKAVQLNRTYAGATPFSAAELNVGDTLTITFNYRFAATPAAGLNYLRVMLYDSGDAGQLTQDGTSIAGISEYSGYYFGLGVGADSLDSQTNVMRRASGNTNTFNSTAGLSSVGNSANGVESGTTVHSVQISLTKGASSNEFVILMDGNEMLRTVDSVGLYSNFDTLGFGNQAGVGVNLYLSDIKVEVIPEGGTVALTLLGGGALMLGLRRVKAAKAMVN